MADGTGIEWTQRPGSKGVTWNPVVGCSLKSPGCTHCFAMKDAWRMSRNPMTPQYHGLTRKVNGNAVWTGEVRLVSHKLTDPLHWREPRTVFVNSMGDLFHEDVPFEWIDDVLAITQLTPQHTYQILTKRADRMAAYFNGPYPNGDGVMARIADATFAFVPTGSPLPAHIAERPIGPALPNGQPEFGWRRFLPIGPLANVWLGTSTERQREADERIPHLLATPAAVRFISAEPLLGPIDLESAWHGENALSSECWGDCAWCKHGYPPLHNCGGLYPAGGAAGVRGSAPSLYEGRDRSGLDWVIAGGESGKRARPAHPDWFRSLRDQCADAGVPFFFKQWGEWAPGECAPGPQTRTERVAYLNEGSDWNFGELTPKVSQETHADDGPDVWWFGKNRSGRLLDGVEHSAFPKGAA